MGWGLGWDNKWKRFVGYGVPATCDHPDSNEQINRGLAHVCGGEPGGGEHGCGLHFSADRLYMCPDRDGVQLCERCRDEAKPFTPKPDVDEWVEHQATDPSWQPWREEQGVETIQDIRALERRLKIEQGIWKEGELASRSSG